jgi:hypothetical protein
MKKFYGLTALLLAALLCGGSAFACDLHKGASGETAGSETTEETGK